MCTKRIWASEGAMNDGMLNNEGNEVQIRQFLYLFFWIMSAL